MLGSPTGRRPGVGCAVGCTDPTPAIDSAPVPAPGPVPVSPDDTGGTEDSDGTGNDTGETTGESGSDKGGYK